MTTNRRQPIGLATLKWFGGAATAAFVFAIANRRIVTIAYRFALWELREQWSFFATLAGAALLLPIVYGVLRLAKIPVLSPRLLFDRYWQWGAAAAAIVVAAMLLLLLPYIRKRYQYFSEASFQIAALERLEANDFAQARSTCTDYLSLYPQRRVGGPWPDPVCAPILTFTDDMGFITAYLRQRPEVRQQTRDGVWLAVDFSVKGPAIAATRMLAGGREASAEPSVKRAKSKTKEDAALEE